MSRFRSRNVTVPHGFHLSGFQHSKATDAPVSKSDNVGMQGCLGNYQWASCDSRYTVAETMTDNNSLNSNSRSFNTVYHVRNNAAVFEGPGALLHFTPPSPLNYHVGINGYLTMNMVGGQSNIPWTDLVVALAKQVEDTISSDFMGAVSLKEMRETITMIRNPFGLFSNKLKRTIPRGMTARTASSTKELSSFWLEYRYGWKPFYSDIVNFSKLIVDLCNRPAFNRELQTWSRFSKSVSGDLDCPPIIYPQGYSDGFWNYISASPRAWWDTGLQGAAGLFRLVPITHTHKSNLSCQQLRPFGHMLTLFETAQTVLGLQNWMQVRDSIWEVLPMSFVVDWFINFNNIWRPISEARLQRADISMLGFSTKQVLSWRAQFMLTYFGNWLNPILPDGGDFLPAALERRIMNSSVGTSTVYQRTAGLPADSEEVLRGGLNLLHTLDGISLFSQRAISGRR